MALDGKTLAARAAFPVPEGMREIAKSTLIRAAACLSPRSLVLRVRVSGGCAGGVRLAGTRAERLLSGCGECFLAAATAGFLPETTGAFAAAYADALGNAALQLETERLEERLAREAVAEGKCLTPRLAPGDGDFPIEAAQELLLALDSKRRAGIYCNAYGALLPVKSAVYLLGLAEKSPACGGDCALCGKPSCAERENNTGE